MFYKIFFDIDEKGNISGDSQIEYLSEKTISTMVGEFNSKKNLNSWREKGNSLSNVTSSEFDFS